MKRILILLGLMAATSLGMQAENRTVTDTVDGKKRVIELNYDLIDGRQKVDTVSITTYEGTDADEAGNDDTYRHRHDGSGLQWVGFNFGDDTPETLVALTAIIFTLGLPALLLFIIFYFRYKNRKAKYRLAEQALATGQQLPPEFFKETKEGESKDLRSRCAAGVSRISSWASGFSSFSGLLQVNSAWDASGCSSCSRVSDR